MMDQFGVETRDTQWFIKIPQCAAVHISPNNVMLNRFPPNWQVIDNVPFNPCGGLTISVPSLFTWPIPNVLLGFWPFNNHTVPGCAPWPLNRQARQREDWLIESTREPVMLITFSGAHNDPEIKQQHQNMEVIQNAILFCTCNLPVCLSLIW